MSRASSERRARNGASKSDSAPAYEWKGFIEIPLDSEAKKQFEVWLGGPDDLLQAIEDAVGDGYKLSVSYDVRNSCFQAALTGVSETCPNRGYTTSGRASLASKAIAVVMFKHFGLAEGGLWENVSAPHQKDDIS
jgi:hypothetical protein